MPVSGCPITGTGLAAAALATVPRYPGAGFRNVSVRPVIQARRVLLSQSHAGSHVGAIRIGGLLPGDP